MITTNRIPAVRDFSVNGMTAWFAELDARDLLFHPDESPETLISMDSGRPCFTPTEVAALTSTIDRLFALHGDEVYEAAYPLFMARMGIKPDA